jgi:tRNA A37 N6-isopentenylltransferase MiaA
MTDALLPGMTIQEATRLASEEVEAQLTAAKKMRTEAELATADAKREATLQAEGAQKMRAELETYKAALEAPQDAASNPVDVAIKNLKESPESIKTSLLAAFVDVRDAALAAGIDVEGLDMYEGWHKLLSTRDNIKYVRAFWRAYASAVAKYFNESAAEAARNAERVARMGAAWKEHVYAITEEGAPPDAVMGLAPPDISFS